MRPPHPRPARAQWFRGPHRLLIIHTVLISIFMLALYLDWTDFTPQPYDCIYLPYLLLSGPIVYGMGHFAMHLVDPFIAVHDIATIRIAWNLIPGAVCLILGGIQWWLIESAYIRLRRKFDTPRQTPPCDHGLTCLVVGLDLALPGGVRREVSRKVDEDGLDRVVNG
jgi:hypothetical protein